MHDFHVTGIPTAQGSKKYVGNGKMIESAKGLPRWRRAVKKAAEAAKGSLDPLDGPLVLTVDFFMPAPAKSKFGNMPAGPPDLDKLLRGVGDALTQSKIIADDARIVTIHATKHWAADEPGAHIRLRMARDV